MGLANLVIDVYPIDSANGETIYSRVLLTNPDEKHMQL